ncbi:MAG: glycosyltransferase family 4 protein [Phycisphaerae bacterium]|nr:glycosyltransferase family 4 protein [Phycisphaerae bacterium]
MRIALIGYYPVRDVITGGQEKVTCLLARVLARQLGHEVHVIAQNFGIPRTETVELDGLAVHTVRDWRIPAAVQSVTLRKRDVVRIIDAVRPDVIHAQEPVYAWQVRATGVPCVLTVHGLFHKEAQFRRGIVSRLNDRFHWHYYRKAIREARYLISISPYAERELGSLTDGQIESIPNVVDDRFFEIEDRQGEPERLLFVGHVGPRKATLELLRVVDVVRGRFPNVRLRLVGSANPSPYLDTVRQYVATAQLEANVDFVGKADVDQLCEEYRRCSVLVLMTRQETAPCVIGEAMAAGKPVVATRICGIPYMVDDGRTGLLAELDDVTGFAEQVMKLLSNDGMRCSMGREGRAKARREYSNEAIAERTVGVYLKAIQDQAERDGPLA